MLTWKLKHKKIIKTGWCHDHTVPEAIITAIVYQTGITHKELKKSKSVVEFFKRNAPHSIYQFK